MVFLSTLGPSLVAKADKESSCQCRRHKRCEFHPLVRKKIPWRRKWLPTPVFLPEKFHGPRSLVGYSLLGSKSQTRLSVSPLNLASQVFVLLLECYAFEKKKKFFFFLIKPKHFFVLLLWRYKLWKIFFLFLCLYKHDSLDFSFPDLIVNSKTSICLYCLHMDLKNLKWIQISVFSSV